MSLEHNIASRENRIMAFKSIDLLPDSFYAMEYITKGILVTLCIKGSMEVQVNVQNEIIKAGNLITILPQSIVNIKTISEDTVFKCLLFDFEDISELILPSDYNFLKTLLVRPIITLNAQDDTLYHQYFDLLIDNYENQYSKFHPQIISYLLFSLIGQINVFYQQEEHFLNESTRKDILVFQFYNLVHQFYETERTVQFYADFLKRTPKYLTTLIRLRTGNSASKVITELVIIKAKSYLSATDLPIYEIAHRLHFADATTFSRYFRKHTQQTPSIYREQQQ